jgi:hypothetical protein
MEAAIRDVLYDKNAEWEIANFGDVIESIDVSRIGDQYE